MLKLIGYQFLPVDQREGLFLFNHSCNTTFSLGASRFLDLYDGPMFGKRLTGSETCPGHCLHQEDLQPCPEKCESACIRAIMQIIQAWPKADSPKRR